jgi:phage shock protein A
VPGSVEFTAPDRLRQLLRGLGVDVSDATTNASLLEVADRWYTEAKEAHEAAEAEARAALEPHGADPHRGIHLPGDPEPLEPDTPADLLARQEALVADLLERSLHLDGELTKHETAFDREAAEIAALEAEVVMLDEQRAASRAQPGPAIDPQAAERAALDATLAADPMVQTAREQASLTAARLDRHHRAVERVDALHAEIGRARATERALTTQRDALHAQLANLRSGSSTTDTGTPLPSVEWTLTEEGVGPIEWYLLGRVASLRSVSAAGSVPLVLDDAFRGLPAAEIVSLCGVLARIGETVQVIYLGDEPAVAAWAEQQGLDLAAAVRPGQPAI